MRAFLLVLYLFQQPLQEAVTLVRQGQFLEAQKKLEGQPEPENPKTRIAFYRLRAAIASGLHQYGSAAAEMRKALSLAPADESLQAAAAYAAIEAGQIDEALTLVKGSQSAPALTLLGIAWYAKGEFKEAEQALRRSIDRDPAHQPAYRSLAQIVLESSSTPAAKSVSLLCKWNEIVCAAVTLREARASGDKALRARSIATLRNAPRENAAARCALGQAYGWSNEWKSAASELESCVTMNPTAQNHYRLAMAYRHLGKAEEARAQLTIRARMIGSQTEDATAGREALRDLPH